MSQNPSTNNNKSNALKEVKKYDVSAELMQQCLNTALYELARMHPFVGSTLQIMNITYSYALPTAGVTFDAEMRRYAMYINPAFFCLSLNAKQRVAVLIHEMAHILNKHLIRVPFMRVSDHKRILLNVAGDLAINQTIQNLPRGCSQCPPLEDQKNGATCENELCPGMCLDVGDYYDEDEATGKKNQWLRNQPLEYYFEKLLEKYEEEPEDEDDNSKRLLVSIATTGNLDATPSGSKRGKTLTFSGNGTQAIDGRQLATGQNVLVKDQTDQKDNGVYVVTDAGSDQSPCVLTRLEAHDGFDQASEVKGGDIAVPRFGSSNKGKFYAVEAAKDHIVDVDAEAMPWVETKGKAGGNGKPRQFDVHDWHANAEESEILDATEELVKRAMVKQSMSYDNLPASVRELLDSIKQRRAELNYRGLILSAIKRSASGHNRDHSWTRRSRRFGNKAPGTKDGNLPKLSLYLDTSGSISIEELSGFLDVVDEFLKVGARTCEINLFSDANYYSAKYKLADRSMQDQIKKSVSMGGTSLESSLKKIHDTKPDLAIFLTDGYYDDVKVEEWMKAGQKFPQVLWVISKDGKEDHPINRLGQTIKIPK